MKRSGSLPTVPPAARELIGRHAGIVRRVVPAVRAEHDPPLFAFAAELCDTSALGPERAVPIAAGAGWTAEAALSACLGEAAERYAAAMYDPDELRMGGAPEDAILPEEVAPFSDAQRRSHGFPFAASGPVRWARGTDLATGRDRWAPASAVFLPYTPLPGEAVHGPALSTGLAAGPSVEAALEAALLEVIERDAFINAWSAGETVPTVDGVADLTNDLGVPVAAVVMEGDVISVGAAAGRAFAGAAERARIEAAMGQIYVRALIRRSPPPETVVTFADHARYYTDHPERRPALEILRGGPRREPPRGDIDPREALLRAGFRPWWRDLTPPDLSRVGIHVVRAIVPGLTPLHSIEAWPFLGAPRMKPRNPHPHPLP